MPSPPNTMLSISGASCTLPGTADVTVNWQCPANTGATIITGFPVSVNGTVVTTASGTDNSFIIAGLALGEAHDIAVAASNCLGTGADSQVQVALPDSKELCQCINANISGKYFGFHFYSTLSTSEFGCGPLLL